MPMPMPSYGYSGIYQLSPEMENSGNRHCVSLFRFWIGSGIGISFHPSTRLPRCRTVQHVQVQRRSAGYLLALRVQDSSAQVGCSVTPKDAL